MCGRGRVRVRELLWCRRNSLSLGSEKDIITIIITIYPFLQLGLIVHT